LSDSILIERAKQRKEVFRNLDKYLCELKSFVHKLDENSKLYLFGSAVRGEPSMISDVDVLVVTDLNPAEVIAQLWRAGFEEPFEFHVVGKEAAEKYFRIIKNTLKPI